MYQFAWDGWAVLALAAFLIGASKTGFPGVGILAILVAAGRLPALKSTGLTLPMLLVADVFAVAFYRRHAVWKHLAKVLPMAAAGVLLGWLALRWLMEGRTGTENTDADRSLRLFIGVLTLVILALNWWRNRKGDLPIPTGWWFPVCMGVLAGVSTMMANAAGPIMIIYLLAMRLPKNEFLGTGAWYYMIMNSLKVPFSMERGLINWDSLHINLILLPLTVAGALAGVWLVKYVPEKIFNIVVQVLVVIAAAALFF